MKTRPQVIEIEELALTGNPQAAAIESAVLRALKEAGVGNAPAGADIHVPVAREVTRAANRAVQRRGV
ncbi:MAG: hypothetical protein LAP86_03585 [Acidobacteriia bacterium]|nr:hypothetical protein [Terriglobia bacterium]